MALLTPDQQLAYVKDLNNYSSAYMTVLQDPMYAWAIPYVTGHKYRFFFDKGQIDLTSIKIEVSERWTPSDKYVLFNLPYTDPREDIDFFTKYDINYSSANAMTYFIPNYTLDQSTYANWKSGYNYNDNTAKKELNFVITGNAAGAK